MDDCKLSLASLIFILYSLINDFEFSVHEKQNKMVASVKVIVDILNKVFMGAKLCGLVGYMVANGTAVVLVNVT